MLKRNVLSVQYSFPFFIISELPWIPRKGIGTISLCVFHGVFLLLHCLPIKARKVRLRRYFHNFIIRCKHVNCFNIYIFTIVENVCVVRLSFITCQTIRNFRYIFREENIVLDIVYLIGGNCMSWGWRWTLEMDEDKQFYGLWYH